MKHRDTHDLIGGLALTAVGVFCAVYAQQSYDFGTLARMGPGFFPTVLGGLLAFCGVLVAVPAWRRSGSPIRIAWRSLFLVLGSVVVFALTLRVLGLVLATFVAAFIATLADNDITWPGRVAVGVGVSAVTVAIFIGGLSMVLPLWWWSV